MRKFWLLFSIITCGLLLIWCNRTIPQSPDTIAFKQLKEVFTWNIIDWTIAEKVLEVSSDLDNEVVDITWDYTLYYNDEFGIATVLWEEWKWYSVIVERYADDFEYSWEVIQIPRYMIKFWKQFGTEDYTVNAYMYHYWFSIVSNEDVEIIKTRPDVWSLSFENDYKWKNNKYSFFETSARKWGGHEYLIQSFPNLDCKTWSVERNDIDWNIHKIIEADCDWYEVINWESIKTRKSWVEQLFPIWFLLYDI